MVGNLRRTTRLGRVICPAQVPGGVESDPGESGDEESDDGTSIDEPKPDELSGETEMNGHVHEGAHP